MTRTGNGEESGGGRGQGRFGWLGGFLRGWTGPGIWRRGIALAVLGLLIALVMIGHAWIPNEVGNLGSLVETFLPWFGIPVVLLILCAIGRRSATALLALAVPVSVWFSLFGGLLVAKHGTGDNLTVATHNVDAGNVHASDTAASLTRSGADVLALEELTEQFLPAYEKALAAAYPYHEVRGTVGVWSKYPLSGTRPVDLELGWTRAMRTSVDTPDGPLAVYVAHLPSVRVKVDSGFTASMRDRSAEALGSALEAERTDRVVLLGDLNGTMNDRALRAVTAQMRSTQGAVGDGFGFSWPAEFPMARIDQIMVRGVEPQNSWTLPRTGSDHLPVAAGISM